MSADPIVVLISFTIRHRRESLATQVMTSLIATVRREEPACSGITMIRDAADPTRVLLYELWPDRESYMGPHMETPHIKALTTASAWFRNGGGTLEQLSLTHAILGGVFLHTGSWLFSVLALKRFKAFSPWLLWETAAVAATGALGGLFLRSILMKTPDQLVVAKFAECFATFAVPGVLAIFLLTATVFIRLASRFTEEQDREWWGRTGSWVLIVMVIWSGLSAIVAFGPGLIAWTPKIAASLVGLSGLLTLVLGFGSRTTAQQQEERSHTTVITDFAVRAAAPFFMLCVLIALSLGSSWQLDLFAHHYEMHLNHLTGPMQTGLGIWPDPWGHDQVLHNTPLWMLFLFTVAVTLLGASFLQMRLIRSPPIRIPWSARSLCSRSAPKVSRVRWCAARISISRRALSCARNDKGRVPPGVKTTFRNFKNPAHHRYRIVLSQRFHSTVFHRDSLAK